MDRSWEAEGPGMQTVYPVTTHTLEQGSSRAVACLALLGALGNRRVVQVGDSARVVAASWSVT
jgi:hypothetical protein